MLLLTSTSDTISVITTVAGSLEVHASWVDNASGTITPGRTNTADITTATTTVIVAAPGAATQRNVNNLRFHNGHATLADSIRILHTDGTNSHDICHAQLQPGETLILEENGRWEVYTAYGILKTGAISGSLYNNSVSAQGAGFATDTYVIGSNIIIPAQRPRIGTRFKCRISVSKTAAGTATPIVYLRYGNNASTADTALCTFTFSAGTAATDVGMFEISGIYRAVGSGTSAVVQGHCSLISQPTTGFSSLLKGVQSTSAGHDSTVSTYLGVSMNGGTSAAWTVQIVDAELSNI